jgi:hypothetical protein
LCSSAAPNQVVPDWNTAMSELLPATQLSDVIPPTSDAEIISLLDRLILLLQNPQAAQDPLLWNGPGITMFTVLDMLNRALIASSDVGEPPKGCLKFSGDPLILTKRLKRLRQWLADQKEKGPPSGDETDNEKIEEAKAKLLEEIKSRGPNGPKTKPEVLIKAAEVRKNIGLKALRALEKDGNYKGFTRRKPRRQR